MTRGRQTGRSGQSGAVQRTGRRTYDRVGWPRRRTDTRRKAARRTPHRTSCREGSRAGTEDTACETLRAGSGPERSDRWRELRLATSKASSAGRSWPVRSRAGSGRVNLSLLCEPPPGPRDRRPCPSDSGLTPWSHGWDGPVEDNDHGRLTAGEKARQTLLRSEPRLPRFRFGDWHTLRFSRGLSPSI